MTLLLGNVLGMAGKEATIEDLFEDAYYIGKVCESHELKLKRMGLASDAIALRRLAKITWRLLEIGAILESRGKCSHTGDTGEVRRTLGALLNERTRRRWAAVEARALGRGGIARVAEATGLSRTTIGAGLRELAEGREDEDASGRLRNPGAGRKSLPVHDAGLVVALEKLVDPATRGDPMGPLRWTCSSAALLARELQAAGQQVSERSVNRLLHELGYSLQANRKTLEGRQHPDRDAQFNHINRQVKAFQRQRQPVVSVDTKKKGICLPGDSARMRAENGSEPGMPGLAPR